MKISIITVLNNNYDTLKYSINSVNNQKYKNFEHIIVVNGRNLDTLSILENYAHLHIIHLKMKHSFYNAINLGIRAAAGDIIFLLDSISYLSDENVLNEIELKFQNNNIDGIIGTIAYQESHTYAKVIRVYEPSIFKSRIYSPYGALVLRSNVYKNYCNFNNEYEINSDIDLLLRLKFKFNLNIIPTNLILSYSLNKSLIYSRYFVQNTSEQEYRKILISNKYKNKFSMLWAFKIYKLMEYIIPFFSIRWLIATPPSVDTKSYLYNGKVKLFELQ